MTLSPASLTFSTTDWSTTQSVTVTAAEDADAADDTDTITLSASGGITASNVTKAVSITDDETEGLVLSTASLGVDEEGDEDFTVKLKNMPSANVTVALMQPSNSTNNDVSFTPTSLDFTTTDWNTAQTVRVSAVDDDDGADDTATIELTASGGNYASVTGRVSVRVTDDDGFELSVSSLEVNENNNATFTVKLTSEPSDDVTVTLTRTAASSTDVTLDETSLTFTTGNWNRIQTVTVSAADDADAEVDTATIKLTAAGGGYDNVESRVSVTVRENDSAGLEISESSLNINEDDTATFTVKLTSEPTATVKVTLAQPSATANDDVTLDKTSLTFTTGNWNTAQTVTVSADDDADDGTATINLTAAGGGYDSATGRVAISVR
ncbi:MAG: hypothetical protein ISN29_12440, partial [Gammaproteobacteria bacterium AqS3]|nr:hypothetical protein [Gammaproteobacteria bacterium AqS3]